MALRTPRRDRLHRALAVLSLSIGLFAFITSYAFVHHLQSFERGFPKAKRAYAVSHTLVHEGGFGVTVTDDGVFVFTRPDSKRILESGSAPRTAPQLDAAERFRGILERLNPDPDVKIDAKTSRCKWLGERMDYSLVIEELQFREAAAGAAATATATPS